jgi:hypothetical protein
MSDTSPAARRTNMKALASVIDGAINEPGQRTHGFALLTFSYDTPAAKVEITSSVDRAALRQMLREMEDAWEAQDAAAPTPGALQ